MMHPTISVGRIFSGTFAGIAPASVPAFVLAQATGGALAILAIRALHPNITLAEAAGVLLPRSDTDHASIDHPARVTSERAPR